MYRFPGMTSRFNGQGGYLDMNKHRIMVVDDSRVVYAEMRKMLEGSEIEIAEFCRSGEEALEKYESVQPELVTLDIVMPGMDGMETCEAMRKRWPNAKIFMVSSMAYEDMINHAAELGAMGFLFKPFTKESLLEGLRGALKAIAQ